MNICGHRGASGYAPENTLEAFALAAEQGADSVELDVHLTRDGELLVAHDETIERVSDGTGLIADLTLAQLKKFNFNKLHPEYENAKAPTLGEVYELLKPLGLQVNVELKTGVNPYPGIEEKCLELAAKMGMEDKVLYSSFNHMSLERIKALNPDAYCGMLYESVLLRPWRYAKDNKMNAVHPRFQHVLFMPDFCARSHRAGIEVNVWTVNSERDMKRVIEAGVDMIITNYPDRARALLNL